MLSKEKIDQFRAMFCQTAVQLREVLEQRQAEIEKETGEKPPLEELFAEIRGNIEQELGISSQPHRALFPEGLPGICLENELGYFIPDLKLLAQIPNWHRGFFPATLTEQECDNLLRLYFDPRFHRLSYHFLGRLSIIAFNEGITEMDLYKRIGMPEDGIGVGEFLQITDENEPVQKVVLTKLIEHYGERYGIGWIVCNEPPGGNALAHLKWSSGLASSELWWSKASKILAMKYDTPHLTQHNHSQPEKKLNWLYHLPKFKKLSSSLHGRMDLICRIELMSREQMAEALELDEEILDHPEEYHDKIVEQLLIRFGDEYGSVWIAYGLYGLDMAFAWQALKDNNAFLRQVPPLFRKNGRTYISYAAARAENRNEDEERKCLNCGNAMTGRIDKQFCCGACQRIYYYHKQNSQVLNGIKATTNESGAETSPDEKPKSGFDEFLSGPLGQIATGALKAFVDRGMNKLGDELFGK